MMILKTIENSAKVIRRYKDPKQLWMLQFKSSSFGNASPVIVKTTENAAQEIPRYKDPNQQWMLRFKSSSLGNTSPVIRGYRVPNQQWMLRLKYWTFGNVSLVIRRYRVPNQQWMLRLNASQVNNRYKEEYEYLVDFLESKIEAVESMDTSHLMVPGMIHAVLIKKEIKTDQILGKVVRLYGSTRKLIECWRLFRECEILDVAGVAVWNCEISSLGIHGEGLRAMQMFENFPSHLKRTKTTYWNTMVACSIWGEFDYAHYLLGKMFKDLMIEPEIEIFGTYIDALARSGRLRHAFREVKTMVYPPNRAIIVTILDRCKPDQYDDMELATTFVRYLEEKGVDYQMTKKLYEELADAGVDWKANVRVLKKRKAATSSSHNSVF